MTLTNEKVPLDPWSNAVPTELPTVAFQKSWTNFSKNVKKSFVSSCGKFRTWAKNNRENFCGDARMFKNELGIQKGVDSASFMHFGLIFDDERRKQKKSNVKACPDSWTMKRSLHVKVSTSRE